jgi:integrase
LFDEAIKTCSGGEHVFAADPFGNAKSQSKSPHINADSVSRAMRRLCDAAKIEDLHLHDMRSAIVSRLDDAEVQESIQSAVLHHTPQDVTSIHYRRSNREQRLRYAWQLWADYVDRIVAGQAAGEQSEPEPSETAQRPSELPASETAR